ncbi:MAG: hypothetical protein ACLSCF_10210 [Alistipes finegoldii]
MEMPFSKLKSPTFVHLPFSIHVWDFFQSSESPVSEIQNDPAFISSMELLLFRRHISMPPILCTEDMSI